QAHGPGVPGQVRRRARQEHDLMAPSDATVAVALPRSLSSRRARELMTGYLYLVPVAIALGGTIVVPILKAMHMSLFNYVLIKPQEYGFVGLGNYTRLLGDETFWLTLWNSFVWVFGSVSLQFLGGFAAALLLHQSFRGRAVVRTVTLLPWIVPGVVVALVWSGSTSPITGSSTTSSSARASSAIGWPGSAIPAWRCRRSSRPTSGAAFPSSPSCCSRGCRRSRR